MSVTLEEVKTYLRVDHDDEDGLITDFILSAERLCEDTLRRPTNESQLFKVAVLSAVAYLYEHRENANMDELSRMLRYILMTEREVVF